MAYDEVSKQATLKYIKSKQQEIKIRYRKDEFDERIQPAIKKSGLPTATFIKNAIEEKIERDKLLGSSGIVVGGK